MGFGFPGMTILPKTSAGITSRASRRLRGSGSPQKRSGSTLVGLGRLGGSQELPNSTTWDGSGTTAAIPPTGSVRSNPTSLACTTNYVGEPQVSMEEEAAMELGVGLGDQLNFLVAGQEMSLTISSIRRINWDSFQPNFFMVLSPGALDDYPTTFVASLQIEEQQRDVLIRLVRAHPTVSVIDLEVILQQVKDIIDKASLAVQAVFAFTIAAGIAVLFAAVQSTIDERRFESALLRALGVRRRTVLSGVLTEFAALGFAAGILASAGASILAAVIAVRLFDLPYEFSPMLWVSGLAAGVILVCTSGFIAARGAINAPPVDVLRAA